MADTTTPTYGLTKPEVGGSTDTWGDKINGVIDDVEDLLDGTTPVTGIDINSGTIDNSVIGGTTPAAGAFTTITGSGDVAVDTDTLYVDATNDRVGVNQASPSEALDVIGDVILSTTGSNDVGVLHFGDTPDETKIIGRGPLHATAPDTIDFVTNTATAMTIDSSGNVGIGTSSPKRELQLGDNTGNEIISLQSSTSGDGSIYFGDNQATSAEYAGMLRYSHSDDSMQFRTSSTERMRIDSSGNVGIGTASPLTKLHVYTDASGATAADGAGDEFVLENSGNCGLTIFTPNTYTASVFFGDPNDSTVGRIQYNHTNDYMRFYTSGSEVVRINSSGQALIAQTSSTVGARSAQLIVQRDAATDCISGYYPTTSTTGSIYRGLSDVGGSQTVKFIVRTDGDVQSATNSYGAISDQVLKQDIVDASSQWDDIKALQVKKYRFTNLVEQDGDDAPVHLGVIAQDLEASGMSGLVSENETLYWEEGDELPEGVSVGDVKDQGYKTVKYSILYMKAVKALQEAMERIETLEAKVAALEAN